MATLAGFSTELVKISADKTEKREKAKKWLKGSAAVAAGTGLGTGAYMLGEKAISKKLGKRWSSLAPATRRTVAGGAAGLATVGGMMLAQRLAREKQKHERSGN
jgi:hypothetical protein